MRISPELFSAINPYDSYEVIENELDKSRRHLKSDVTMVFVTIACISMFILGAIVGVGWAVCNLGLK